MIAANGQAVTNGASGSQYNLGEFSPVGTVVSNANSPGASGVTYGLIKHGTNPLQINTSTGQVTLGSALDYETANNFRYQVTATVGGETRTSGIITYQVNNESYTMPSFNSTSVTNTNFVGNRMYQATNTHMLGGTTNLNRAISYGFQTIWVKKMPQAESLLILVKVSQQVQLMSYLSRVLILKKQSFKLWHQ